MIEVSQYSTGMLAVISVAMFVACGTVAMLHNSKDFKDRFGHWITPLLVLSAMAWGLIALVLVSALKK